MCVEEDGRLCSAQGRRVIILSTRFTPRSLHTACTTNLLQGLHALRGQLNEGQSNTVPFLAKNQHRTVHHPSRSRASNWK